MHVLSPRDVPRSLVKAADRLGDALLPRMRLDPMQVLIEGIVDAAEDLEGKGGRDGAQRQQFPGSEQGKGRQGGHGAGAVDQGKTFLEAEPERRQTLRFQGLSGGRQLSFVKDRSLADDRQGQVGKMHEVPGGADAAALRDIGGDARIDHVPHQFQQRHAHAAVAFDQRVEPHGHDSLRDVVLQRIAQTRRMAADQIHLQIAQIILGDDLVAHGTEGGVHSVDDPPGSHFLFEKCPASPASVQGRGIQGHRLVADADGHDIIDRQIIAVEDYFRPFHDKPVLSLVR